MTNRQVIKDAIRAVFLPASRLTRDLFLQVVDLLIDFFSGTAMGLDMQVLTIVPTTADGALVSSQGIAIDFRGVLDVKRNGRSVAVWRGVDSGPVSSFSAYFCVGNSLTPRPNDGSVQMGDTLRWNSSVAGPLIDGDSIWIVAAIGIQLPPDPGAASGFVPVSTPEQLAAANAGPYPKIVVFDNGVDDPVFYYYSPRLGLRESWSFPPTTPTNT